MPVLLILIDWFQQMLRILVFLLLIKYLMKPIYKIKQRAQEETVKLSKDFYYENGYKVMTEKYHLKRGYCCKNKCRHCPYER